MRRFRSGQSGLSYLAEGPSDAPLVICLHGFPDIPRTWAPLTRPLLEAGYRVVQPWLPGYAPSTLDGPFDPIAVTRRVLDLADELSPTEPVRFVGHDWGSIVGQCACALEPDRFRAAVLLAVPHLAAIEAHLQRYPEQGRSLAYMGLFQLPVASDRVVSFRNYRFIERLWSKWSPGFDPGDDYFDELKLCLRSSMPAPLRYYRALLSVKSIRALRAMWADGPIVVPTLYLHGERDGCIPVELARGQERYFSALFESVHFAEAGHFLHLERPAEVNEAILRWLAAH